VMATAIRDKLLTIWLGWRRKSAMRARAGLPDRARQGHG
jgi:hypothetical protein